jgi:CubicO group peptidase (beta-lactamase class C family)
MRHVVRRALLGAPLIGSSLIGSSLIGSSLIGSFLIGSFLIGALLFAAALLLASSPATVAAQGARDASLAPPAAFADPQREAKLRSVFPAVDARMRAFAERTHVPGIAYGLVIDGRLAHVGVAGLRDVGAGALVDTATVFRIASMTKSFTAVSILQLRDAGRLSLDDSVARYVPELATLRYPTSDSPPLTIRLLLSHSEGFPEDNPWGDQQLARTRDEMGAMMRAGIPFSTAPGTAYEYSNFGFAILGRVVENVSGMRYADYVRERVLRPLGMTVTTLEARTVPPNRLAHGYRRQDGKWLEEEQLPDGAFGSMGGMLTSAADLGRWVAFMLDAWPPRDGDEGNVLRRASRREMQQVWRFNGATAVKEADGSIALSAGGYGYGLGVRQTCRFRITIAHSGGLPGFGSLMRWLPEYGIGIVAMGNLTYTGWSGVSDEALDLLAATGALEPRQPQPAPVLSQMREQVTRLITKWDDTLADSIGAMNLYRDESKERRRAAIERVRFAAGDRCAPEGAFVVENALRGRWRIRCASGDLRVAITLAPTSPARVQFLDVSPMQREESLQSAGACR